MINEEYLFKCTDDQINLCVAWIKASKITLTPYSFILFEQINGDPIYCGHYYRPTFNYNECMPLAIECGMSIEFPHKDLCDIGTISVYIEDNTNIYFDFTNTDNHLRIICEAYILSNI
jgi:hypothetical protein